VEPAPPDAPHIVARSPAARTMLAQIARAARTTMPVLITGETGTGKEEAARLIHAWSGREGPWLPINCAAIPNELMESELFGHVRGAFSGAVGSVDGKLRAAAGGTVFLDEIDDTPLSTQVKLLRVLEDGEVTRVGETRGAKVDFRIVAATNRDLLGLVEKGRFGDDLYQRLAIVHLVLPPLRQRRDDIAPLARHFVETYYKRQPRTVRARVDAIADDAIAALLAYDWPGNVRELRNVIFQALVYKRAGRELLLSDLRRLLTPPERSAGATSGAGAEASLFSAEAIRERVVRGAMNLRAEIERLEGIALRAALEHANGSPTRAARLLGEVGHGRSSDPGGTVRAMMKRLRIG
jgi:DNA-binding NtrC family response regulator